MAVLLEGYNTSVGTTYTTLSTRNVPRVVFIQARSNIFVRVNGKATAMVVLGDTSGAHWDLGVNPPNTIEVAAISGSAEISMWSLDPGERR